MTKYKDYAFTVKARKSEDQASENYLILFALWREKYNVQIPYAIPEKDKRGRLHYHGLVKIPSNLRYKDLIPCGHSCWFKRITEAHDYAAWRTYCEKDCRDILARDLRDKIFAKPQQETKCLSDCHFDYYHKTTRLDANN